MRWWQSLKIKLVLLVILALLIPTVANSVYHLNRTARGLSELAEANFQQQVRDTANEIENVLIAQQADVLFLSQSPTVRRFINNPARSDNLDEVVAFLSVFLSRNEREYTGACLLDATGQEQACLHIRDKQIVEVPSDQLDNRSDRDYFTEPLSLISIPGAGVPVYTANVLFDTEHAIGEAQRVIRFSTLLQSDGGEIVGVMVLATSFDYLVGLMDCGETCQTFELIDSDGRQLAASQALTEAPEQAGYSLLDTAAIDQILAQPAGSLQGTAASPDVLTSFARVDPPGQGTIQWTLAYHQSLNVVLSDVYEQRDVTLLLTPTLLVLTLVIAIWMIRRITRPLNQLTLATYQIAQGNLDVPLPDQKTSDEIGSLTQAFDTMLAQLRTSIKDLRRSKDETEASEARFRAVFDRASEAILLTNDAMRYVDVNNAACDIFGIERERFLQMRIPDLVSEAPVEGIMAEWQAMLDEGQQSGEMRVNTPDGREVILDYRAVAHIIPGLHLSILRDVTQRKTMENQLRDLNEHLEQRIAESTAELRIKHEQLKMLTDNASDLICLHTLDGTFHYVSPSATKLLGYQPETLISQRTYSWFHPDDLERARTVARRIFECPSSEERGVYRIRHRDGSYLPVETIIRPVRDATGEPAYILSISRDITERLRLESQLRAATQFLDAVMDALTAHIAVVNNEGVIVAVNAAWQHVANSYAIEPGAVLTVGQNYLTICEQNEDHDSTARKLGAGIRGVLNGAAHDFYLEYPLKPGEEIPWFAVRVTRFEDRGVPHAVIAHTDISETKQQELHIQEALEQEQHINELRSRFVSMVSHDFRTPLASIQTATDVLMRYDVHLSAVDRRERLIRIQKIVQHMNQMLEDVLYIGRAQLGEVRFEPEETDVVLFCRDIASDIGLAFGNDHRIDLVTEGDPRPVMIDKALMHKIVMNLLSNALKYSEGQVRLKVCFTPEELIVSVHDQGIGIPEADQDALFETFHRASNVGSITGTGLGLAIVHESVDIHGGTIDFESVEGDGSWFCIHLPLGDPEHTA
ncbi:MAG: PAS domain S-box protein [Chloroflexota bacterium]